MRGKGDGGRGEGGRGGVRGTGSGGRGEGAVTEYTLLINIWREIWFYVFLIFTRFSFTNVIRTWNEDAKKFSDIDD